MDQNLEIQSDNHIELATEIVAAYVSNNSVPLAGLAELIASVHGALSGLGASPEPAEPKVEKATATQIKKSITDDALISFEDGKPYRTLKRHLTALGLTPEAYRIKHGLPPNYPITSPGYSAKRSKLARSFGLGQKRPTEVLEAANGDETASDVTKASNGSPKASADAGAVPEKAKGRGRPRKGAEATEAGQEG